MINIIIADDHPIIRKGLKQIFDQYPEMGVGDDASVFHELQKK